MDLIEDKDFLTQEQKNFIENILLSNNFPFYINYSAVEGDGNKFFSHCLLRRPEERIKGQPLFNSSYAEQIVDIFKTFIIKNKINCEEMLRCSVNLTFKTMSKKCPVHLDHDYDHKQLLIYLNDCVDKEAKTVLLDDTGKKVLHEIIPEKFKGVCFGSCPHYMSFPKKDIRVVLVYTFI